MQDGQIIIRLVWQAFTIIMVPISETIIRNF